MAHIGGFLAGFVLTFAFRGSRSAWIEERHVRIANDAISEYQVNMMVTFIIDD
jgi:hypothetical protein